VRVQATALERGVRKTYNPARILRNNIFRFSGN